MIWHAFGVPSIVLFYHNFASLIMIYSPKIALMLWTNFDIHTHARTYSTRIRYFASRSLSIVIVKNAYLANELHSSLLSNSIEKCCRYESFESEISIPAHTCQNQTSKFSEDTLIHIVGCDKISQSCYFICFFVSFVC